jgi:hypothetical protein
MEYNPGDYQAFAGDPVLKNTFAKLCREYDIKTIIETGTFVGGTTRELSKMAEHVFTIEHSLEFFQSASLFLSGLKNITMEFGSSISRLKGCIDKAEGNILLFLDAHWGENNPLLGELEIIAKSGIKPIIAIHDFKNPNHPEYAFDTYGSIVYEWNWIESSIKSIYGENGFRVEYNDNAEGPKVGVIFIYPNESN